MILYKDLIHFGYMNKNNRIYSVKSYDWNEIKQRSNNGTLLGEMGNVNSFDVSLTKVSHVIKNIEVYQDGIIGEVYILDTERGKELKTLIDSGVKMVFRPRSIGVIDDNGNVTIKELFTFDAILQSDDAFYDMDLFRYMKIEKIMQNIKNK